MHSLLAPILAQVVTVGLGDHVEGRYVVDTNERYVESSNETVGVLEVAKNWRRGTLRIGYTPSLTIVPLEETPRDISLFHTASLGAQYRWRRSSLSLDQTVGYGDRDYVREALAPSSATPGQQQPNQPPPATPPDQTGATPGQGGEPTPGTTAESSTAAPSRAVHQVVHIATSTTRATFTHALARSSAFVSYLGYNYNGGVDEASRVDYPIVQGPTAGLSVSEALDARNRFETNLDGQIGRSATNDGLALTLTETWTHNFALRTEGHVGGGIGYARNKPEGEATAHNIYPTGHAGISHSDRVGGGTLTLRLNASAAPVLDFTTGAVDPRLSADAGAAWVYRRFSISAELGSAISVAQNDEVGTFNSVGASLTAAYDIGAGFSIDGGVRAAWQSFEGVTIIEPTSVLFVGLRWGVVGPITRPE